MVNAIRFLEYRRANWFSGNFLLEERVRTAWQTRPTNLGRVVVRVDGSSVMGMEGRDFGRNGFAIHCATYTERQGVGVVGMAESSVSHLSEKAPGNDENFANNDFFALVLDDHVITLNANRNAASLRSYLHGLFPEIGLHEDSTKFDIVRIADANEIARIEQAGVSHVEMDLGIEEATAIAIADARGRKSVFSSFRQAAAGLVDALANRDDQVGEIGTSRKGTVKVLLGVPSRDLETARSGLDGVAEELVGDDEADSFVIRLRNGETIRPGEIAVKQRVSLERYADTVNADEVWDAMNKFMSKLRASGQLEA